MHEKINAFLDSWQDDSLSIKAAVRTMYEAMRVLPDTEIEFVPRPGVSYSLRAKLAGSSRPFYAAADIIDDDPQARWLSVCFFNASVSDPAERGDAVPGGLFGEDARCFDIDGPQDDPSYLPARIAEAHAWAAAGRG